MATLCPSFIFQRGPPSPPFLMMCSPHLSIIRAFTNIHGSKPRHRKTPFLLSTPPSLLLTATATVSSFNLSSPPIDQDDEAVAKAPRGMVRRRKERGRVEDAEKNMIYEFLVVEDEGLVLKQAKKFTFELTVKQLMSERPGEWMEELQWYYLLVIDVFFSIMLLMFMPGTTYAQALKEREVVAVALRGMVRKSKERGRVKDVKKDTSHTLYSGSDMTEAPPPRSTASPSRTSSLMEMLESCSLFVITDVGGRNKNMVARLSE